MAILVGVILGIIVLYRIGSSLEKAGQALDRQERRPPSYIDNRIYYTDNRTYNIDNRQTTENHTHYHVTQGERSDESTREMGDPTYTAPWGR